MKPAKCIFFNCSNLSIHGMCRECRDKILKGTHKVLICSEKECNITAIVPKESSEEPTYQFQKCKFCKQKEESQP